MGWGVIHIRARTQLLVFLVALKVCVVQYWHNNKVRDGCWISWLSCENIDSRREQYDSRIVSNFCLFLQNIFWSLWNIFYFDIFRQTHACPVSRDCYEFGLYWWRIHGMAIILSNVKGNTLKHLWVGIYISQYSNKRMMLRSREANNALHI